MIKVFLKCINDEDSFEYEEFLAELSDQKLKKYLIINNYSYEILSKIETPEFTKVIVDRV